MIQKIALLLLLPLAVWSGASHAADAAAHASTDASRPPRGLTNAPGSIEALLDRFLAALERKDGAALDELRVSREEYVDLIVPGTVEKGKPPRQVSEAPKKYFWEMLDFKSREFGKLLAERYGGRHYVDRQVAFSEPRREYAWYTAHGQLRMSLKAEDASVYELTSGWIAEVDGKFKFIGFEWDN